MKPRRIPLFPLDVVLLPGMALPLHIFEPRYKLMIGRCLHEHIEFGMILAQDSSASSVGCTAEITRRIKDYPDGRMDILVEGRAVFRLIELLADKDYYEGIVDYLSEDAMPQDPHKEKELTEIFQQCHLLLFGHVWHGCNHNDGIALAYRLASRLPLDLKQRQTMLEKRSESERRDFLLR
jgi:Lon protease-like protein